MSSNFSGLTNTRQQAVIKITDATKGSSIIFMNSPVGMAYLLYRYKFWGFPKGVSMPPKFAAIFCIINVNAMYFVLPVEFNTK